MTREDWLRDIIKERYKSLFNFSRQIQDSCSRRGRVCLSRKPGKDMLRTRNNDV